jgi:hypothetical protein
MVGGASISSIERSEDNAAVRAVREFLCSIALKIEAAWYGVERGVTHGAKPFTLSA